MRSSAQFKHWLEALRQHNSMQPATQSRGLSPWSTYLVNCEGGIEVPAEHKRTLDADGVHVHRCLLCCQHIAELNTDQLAPKLMTLHLQL